MARKPEENPTESIKSRLEKLLLRAKVGRIGRVDFAQCGFNTDTPRYVARARK